GQEFFVRRLQKERDRAVTRETPGTIRTAGWIRVYAVDDEMSLATIQYACDNVIIDRGKDHGIVPGSQFVVYNDKKQPGNFLFESAEAVAVDVRETSS